MLMNKLTEQFRLSRICVLLPPMKPSMSSLFILPDVILYNGEFSLNVLTCLWKMVVKHRFLFWFLINKDFLDLPIIRLFVIIAYKNI